MHLQNTITITYRLTGMLINEATIGAFGLYQTLVSSSQVLLL